MQNPESLDHSQRPKATRGQLTGKRSRTCVIAGQDAKDLHGPGVAWNGNGFSEQLERWWTSDARKVRKKP